MGPRRRHCPLRVSLPYLLDEVSQQMIPSLLSSRQLQTWMG